MRFLSLRAWGVIAFERDWQEQSGQVEGKIKSGLPENFYNEGWLADEIDDGPTGLLSRMGEKNGRKQWDEGSSSTCVWVKLKSTSNMVHAFA